MICMQYNIKLPADYDMNIIKNRVKENGNKTDGFKDLHLKAYLIAEKNRHNNSQNEYAPFYVWNGVEGMNEFLLGGPYNNILNSFGWTSINTWQAIHTSILKSNERQYAVIIKRLIPSCLNFSDLLEQEQITYIKQCENSEVTASVIAYNPTSWEICNLVISKNINCLKSLDTKGLIYDVHHIS